MGAALTMGFRRSLALSFLEKYLGFGIQFASSLIMARLLPADAFGSFAIAMSIMLIAQSVREMGVGAYLVQAPALTTVELRAAFTVSLAASVAIGIVLLALLPVVGQAYGDETRAVLGVLMVQLLLAPFSGPIISLLHRDMNFRALLPINLAGIATNAAVAILLGWMGWNSLALAWANVMGQGLVTAWALTAHRHRISFALGGTGTRSLFRFGLPVMLSDCLQHGSTSFANLLTAHYVNLYDMGLLSRAMTFTSLFSRLIMDAVHPMVLPTLAAMRRGETDVALALRISLTCLSAVTWPFFLFIGLHADLIIQVLYGAAWLEATPLLQLMAIGGFFWIIQPIASPVLIACGHVVTGLRVQATNQAVAILGVLSAAPFGVVAVAVAGIAVAAFQASVWLIALHRAVPFARGALWRIAGQSLLVTASAISLPLGLDTLFAPQLPVLALLLGGIGLATGWLVGLLITRHPLWVELVRFVQWASIRRHVTR